MEDLLCGTSQKVFINTNLNAKALKIENKSKKF